jgi:hypothetical protein
VGYLGEAAGRLKGEVERTVKRLAAAALVLSTFLLVGCSASNGSGGGGGGSGDKLRSQCNTEYDNAPQDVKNATSRDEYVAGCVTIAKSG